jgi:hypothetical protein
MTGPEHVIASEAKQSLRKSIRDRIYERDHLVPLSLRGFFLIPGGELLPFFFLSKRPLVQYIDRTQIGVHFDSLA